MKQPDMIPDDKNSAFVWACKQLAKHVPEAELQRILAGYNDRLAVTFTAKVRALIKRTERAWTKKTMPIGTGRELYAVVKALFVEYERYRLLEGQVADARARADAAETRWEGLSDLIKAGGYQIYYVPGKGFSWQLSVASEALVAGAYWSEKHDAIQAALLDAMHYRKGNHGH